MDNRYGPRGSSPTRSSRRYFDPRASAGTVISSAFDTRYNPPPHHRGSLDPSRLSDFGYEAQPIKKKTYVDSGYGGSTASRTEYAVRPRQESLTGENRRPVSTLLLPTSPTRTRPVITTNFDPRDPRDPRERPRSPVSRSSRPRDDVAGAYLSPISAGPPRNHQRHHSATPTEMDRLTVARRDGRDRAGGGYHRTGEARQPTYLPASSRPPIRIAEDDVSYTGPREQFARDFPSRSSGRDSYTRGDRPVSIMGPPDWKPARDRRELREPGPPPLASRQLERLDRPDTSRRPGHESDSDRDAPRRRNSTRNPVVHQDRDDDYERRHLPKHTRDRYEDDQRLLRDRDYDKLDRPVEARRKPRSRESSPPDSRRIPRSRDSSPEHRSGISKGLAAMGLGGIAAAGLAGARHREGRDKDDPVEESDSDRRKERRRRKHRDHDHDADEPGLVEHGRHAERDLLAEKANGKAEDESEDGHKHRKHRRRRHRHRDENDQEVASESSSDKPVQFSAREENVPRGREESDISDSEVSRELLPTGLGQRTISPGEDENGRPRRVALVEPPKEEDRPKPKGILKQRTVPFPEDPNPSREGVAPLKEAGKDGVPPGARWTKINRVLVNPEALEKSKERFEERDDYVIVLRVLTKEEIAKLAEKTREIREARELAWQEEVARKKKSKERRRSRGDYTSDDDEEGKPPLAIEAPQEPAPEPWIPNQQQARDPMGRTVPENLIIPGISGPNFVPETYSTNV